MSAITLRDGTIVSHEVCTRFGITEENAPKRDFETVFDMLEMSGMKAASAPRPGASGFHYINVARGEDKVRRVTLEVSHADSVTVSIPAMGLQFAINKK